MKRIDSNDAEILRKTKEKRILNLWLIFILEYDQLDTPHIEFLKKSKKLKKQFINLSIEDLHHLVCHLQCFARYYALNMQFAMKLDEKKLTFLHFLSRLIECIVNTITIGA